MTVRRRNREKSVTKQMFGKYGHQFFSDSKNFIEPNINYVQFDKFEFVIKDAFTTSFENKAEYNRFLSALAQSGILSRKPNNAFTFKSGLLFSGNMGVYRDYNSSGSFPVVIKLTLYLNLTRAARHAFLNHPGGGVELADDESEAGFSFIRYIKTLPAETALEKDFHYKDSCIGLDDEDNVMPLEVLFDMRPAKKAFLKYFDKILELIEETLEAAAENVGSGRPISRSLRDWHVNHGEFYWEYVCPDALSLMRWFKDTLPHLFSQSEVANYIYDDESTDESTRAQRRRRQCPPTQGREFNCPTLRVGLGNKDVMLVMYAKKLDRIRFEIRYSGNLKQILKSGNIINAREGLERILDLGIIKSHGYLARVFEFIPADTLPKEVNIPRFTAFIGALAQAVNAASAPPEIFEKILPLLLTENCIRAKKDTIEHTVCEALASEDILEKSEIIRASSSHRHYVLCSEYRDALETMLGGLKKPPAKIEKKKPKIRKRKRRA